MKNTFISGFAKMPRVAALLALALAQAGERANAATYRVGDTVTNFTFVARQSFTRPDGAVVPAGSSVHLSDFAGRIVFLEWFAVWCPYCVAAAPQVKTGIVDWYATRNGNSNGVPVLHIAVNQEAASFYQTQTDSFITREGFNPVVNDYDSIGTNRVRFMFQSSGQPIFVVINAVTNSPTHRPWQLLVNHLGYGDTDFNQELTNFRAIIDTVQLPAPAPQLGAPQFVDENFEFDLQTQPGRAYRVQSSTNLADWVTLSTNMGATNSLSFRDTNAPPEQRFYRVVTP
jgi:thiol-disulfide isomerase/thioredoxin